ncbi:MAG: YlxR family protein [Clostridia bacterium]|nr:YlxR family protein [Clostridia bacterium]
MKQKKIPMRMCTGCGQMKPKRELVRVVKAPDQRDEEGNVLSQGEVSLDLTGRKNGRGAYICRSVECFNAARRARRFEKAFSCRIPEEVYDAMEEEIGANE